MDSSPTFFVLARVFSCLAHEVAGVGYLHQGGVRHGALCREAILIAQSTRGVTVKLVGALVSPKKCRRRVGVGFQRVRDIFRQLRKLQWCFPFHLIVGQVDNPLFSRGGFKIVIYFFVSHNHVSPTRNLSFYIHANVFLCAIVEVDSGICNVFGITERGVRHASMWFA